MNKLAQGLNTAAQDSSPVFGVRSSTPEPFTLKEDSMTRGHKAALVKPYSRLDKRKFSFSQRTITDTNNLSHDCVNASSGNMFKNKIYSYLARAGYT